MKKLFWPTFILFSLFFSTGLFLASQKLIWNDEIYTQLENMQAFSLTDILTGHTKEGNLCPLFYAPQKIFLSLCNYHLPFEWKHESNVYELRSQILMRIPPVIYMSLGLTLIFYVFARYYSYRIGLLALGLALSNPMVWMYWAEARPYGLWFLLTVMQACLFLRTFHKADLKAWLWLGLCHILLSLTIIFSLPQILIVTLAVGIMKKMDWKKILWSACCSILICYFYYAQAKKVYVWMPGNIATDLQFALKPYSMSALLQVKEWFLSFIPMNLPFIWTIPFIFYMLLQKGKSLKEELGCFTLTTLGLLFSSGLILLVFSSWSSSGIKYAVSERYFIFLIPFALFTIVLSYIHWMRRTQEPLLRRLILCVYIATILVSALKTLNYLAVLGVF